MRGVARALFFFFNDTATTEIYTLSLHDALPIYIQIRARIRVQTLTGHQFRGLQQRTFVVGLELEELLVDRRRFDELPFFAKGIGDLQELFDRALGLAPARVQIAERVRGVPVARLIFDNAQAS